MAAAAAGEKRPLPGVISAKAREKRDGSALGAIFASQARVAVLRVFMLDPARAYYQRQIEAATGVPIRGVQRELERLGRAGLLFRRVEGNRTYFQADMEFPLFPELRGMVLKTAAPPELLRAAAALDPAVRICLLHPDGDRALIVHDGAAAALRLRPPAGIALELMEAGAFAAALQGGGRPGAAALVELYLRQGADLLGRREDVLWRHIEAAGHAVRKGDGVP